VEIAGDPVGFNFTKWPVLADGTAIGRVTSAVHSPRLGRNIGYAMVPLAHAAEGSALTVVTEEGEREATVVPMPFVDPTKEIPKT
jgi:glycine cleavage system aminomethyltransferase T